MDGGSKRQSAADDPLAELGRRIRSLVNALPTEEELKAKRIRLPKSAVPLEGHSLDKRLREIDDRPLDTRLMAQLLGRHEETIRRRVKTGMPHSYEGRNLRFFGPQVADWLLERSEARKRSILSRKISQAGMTSAPTLRRGDGNDQSSRLAENGKVAHERDEPAVRAGEKRLFCGVSPLLKHNPTPTQKGRN